MYTKTPPMPTRKQNVPHIVLIKAPPMPARTQYLSQLVLIKTNHTREETNVSQSQPMLPTAQIAPQHVFTKSLPCQRRHKMYLKLDKPNSSQAARTKYFSICVDQTHSMPSRTQNVSQIVLSKPL